MRYLTVKHSNGFVHLILIIGVVLVGIIVVGYFAIKNGQIKVNNNNLAVSSPTPTPQVNETEDLPSDFSLRGWKTYRNKSASFKYPSTWKENPKIPTGSGFIQEFSDNEGRFAFTFLSIGNYNQITGKSYESLDDYINLPYTVKILQVGGQEARQPLPRAGSENVNSVKLFSKDNKSIYTIELKTGNTPLDTSELEIQEGQKIFNQILSTFNFDDSQSQTVKLYFYKSSLDPNTDCLDSAVVPVERDIESSGSTIKDTIDLLLKGATEEERQQGYSSEFPHDGFYLISSNLDGGILTLEFPVIYGFTTGGSCRVGILDAEVRKTALQFPDVKEVRIEPEKIFSP